ncbi:DUF1054 domain-containing protein [Bacillus sp. ISL-47]|uniref:YktB family protein n=1 Tax=Bacillus sp. ISL-47 TaxID=2819130 RepID=UPI001BEBE67F|nr:DUF1054 domain-containing protein [Bacillus sp. ISL-47]MBT2687870.1 DUF1054 domain-containing protein [Bacillus sp. ISL-47]MBT2708053.1 DUF1054 domain-containing protein [Pseudomonas sp. ISL-84]
MAFSGFTNEDFNVFEIDGLDDRMEALKSTIRPKLEELGQHFAPSLSALSGDEMFPHVAKHARRTKNPPKDTWVAFASNSRGYKMLPHFQIGLWETHVFIWFAVIYEAPSKEAIGKAFEDSLDKLYKEVPKDYVWSVDHTKPSVHPHSQLSKDELQSMFVRLQTVKKAEILCGINIPREEAVSMSPDQFIEKADSVFRNLLPLYKMA